MSNSKKNKQVKEIAVSERVRAKKWTMDELQTLTNELQDKKIILFSSQSNTVTNSLKNNTWAEVAARVSAVSSQDRTAAQCRKKWSDFKRKMKYVRHSKEGKFTGEGNNPGPSLNDIEAKALAILGDTAVKGLEGGFDTESQATPVVIDSITEDDERHSTNEDKETESNPSDDESENGFMPDVIAPKERTEMKTSSHFVNDDVYSSASSDTEMISTNSTPKASTSKSQERRNVLKAKPAAELRKEPVNAQEKLLQIEEKRIKIQEEQLNVATRQCKAVEQIAMFLERQNPDIVYSTEASSEGTQLIFTQL